MPRVLFDIDFSNQSFNNTADESDWILSPVNALIIPETATYINMYCYVTHEVQIYVLFPVNQELSKNMKLRLNLLIVIKQFRLKLMKP